MSEWPTAKDVIKVRFFYGVFRLLYKLGIFKDNIPNHLFTSKRGKI